MAGPIGTRGRGSIRSRAGRSSSTKCGLADSLPIWTRSIDQAAARQPIHGLFRGRSFHALAAAVRFVAGGRGPRGPGPRLSHRAEQQHGRLAGRLAERLGPVADGEPAAGGRARRRYLQFFDAVSLWFCCAERHQPQRIELSPAEGWTFSPLGIEQGCRLVRIEPWPLNVDCCELSVSGRLVPRRITTRPTKCWPWRLPKRWSCGGAWYDDCRRRGEKGKRKRIKGYLNRFLHHRITPQAMIASTPVLGSGVSTLATRNPMRRTRRRTVVAPVRGGQVERVAEERTAPQAPKRAANQRFVPLKNVAVHVIRAVGARRSAVRADVGQIADGIIVVRRVGRRRGAARGWGGVAGGRHTDIVRTRGWGCNTPPCTIRFRWAERRSRRRCA